MSDPVPQFPQYQPIQPTPPAPTGIPFIDPKFHKPLYKMMNMMFKNRKTPKVKIRTGRRKKAKFY